jgi:hypothetical protein
MYKACQMGQFPSIENVCGYGLSGYGGTNPVAIFDCYRSAVKNGVTEKELETAMKRGTLNETILKSPNIERSPYFLEVMKSGGIKVPPSEHYECATCGWYSTRKRCIC